MLIVNGNLITEMVKIEEEILGVMQGIINSSSRGKIEFDDELYQYLRMFVQREKRLISKLPIDIDFISFVIQNIDKIVIDNIENPDNTGKIISRISTLFNNLSFQIKPSEKYASVFVNGSIQQYDLEEEYNQKIISIRYNKELMKRYLKSLDNMKSLGIYDNHDLFAVQFLNLFIYNDITDEYCNSSFNINNIDTISDEEFVNNNNINLEEFMEMKYDIILSNIMVLISLLMNNSSDSIDYKDADYNFKYLISELSYDYLLDLKDRLDDVFEEVLKDCSNDKIDVIVSLDDFIENELLRKERISKFDNSKISYDLLSDEQHTDLINLVYFEKKLLETFDSLNFSFTDNEKIINNLANLVNLEKDFVDNIDWDSISLSDISKFLNVELKEILNQDYYDREFSLINYRIGYLIPQFRNLFISPSQSQVSHDIILRNYLSETLRNYFELLSSFNDLDIKDDYMQLYKDQFFMYPPLTSELISFKGNHLLIDSVSDDLAMEVANIEEIEYYYDIDEQLFKEAEDIIEEFSGFDIDYLGSSYCQFRLIQFDYILRYLSLEKLDILSDKLYANTDIISEFKNIISDMVEANLIDDDYDLDVSVSSDNILIKVLRNNSFD